MSNQSSKLITSLRDCLAAAISDFKAYDVPGVCLRIGLREGTEEEAYQSKFTYAKKRIAELDQKKLIASAKQLQAEIENYYLGEVIAKLDDLNSPEVTSITRRRLVRIFEDTPIATIEDELDLLHQAWPLNEMAPPDLNYNGTMEDYVHQHFIRNEDLNTRELLECLGLLDCSQRQLFHFLETLTSAEFQDEFRQTELSKKINAYLVHDGFTLEAVKKISGSPVYKVVERKNAAPSDLEIGEALKNFEPHQIKPRWEAALESRSADPERAITLARTLLEDVCKWILHESEKEWEEKDDLPSLYRKTSEILNLAPDNHTEQIFKQILGSCQSVVSSLGSLRNKLSDAHSIGPRRTRPAARHAELAVNLSGAMSQFLISTWQSKKKD